MPRFELLESATGTAGKRPLTGVLGLLVALVLTGCSSGESTDVPGVTNDTITVGTTNALTGPAAAVCSPFTKGTEAWFKHLNAEGGVDGRTIEYKVLDDAYTASRAVANARTLVNDPVFAVVGGCGSIQAAAIYRQLDDQGVPYLFPQGGANALFSPVVDNVFGLYPTLEIQVREMIPYAFERSGPGSVYLVANQLPDFELAVDYAEEQANENGGKFLGSSATAVGTTDYTPIALKVKAAKPDYVSIEMAGQDAAKFVNALVAQDALPTKAILGASTMASEEFATAYDPAADEKLWIPSPISLPLDDADSDCADALRAADLELSPFLTFGCLQGRVFTEALERSENVTRADLIATLEKFDSVDLGEPFPRITFTDDNHHGIDSLFVVQLKNRKFTTLPEQIPYGALD